VKEEGRVQVAVVVGHQDELIQPLKVLSALHAGAEKHLQEGPEEEEVRQGT
jgi:hypothetical protein